MSTYLVHLPRGAANTPDLSPDPHFIRDGFSLVAFLFTPIWLLANRLWLGFVGWVLCSALLIAAFFWGAVSVAFGLVAYALVAFLIGLEAGQLRSHAASRRKHILADVAIGDAAAEAARAYFEAAAAERGRVAPAPVEEIEPEERQP